jgi:hypothetical protein
MPDHQDARLEELARTIADRLRSLCSHMPEPAFEAMVRRMAAIEIKYIMRTATGAAGPGRVAPERS